MDSVPLGEAVAGDAGPPDPADHHEREHPTGCAWTMRVCPQAGERGDAKRIMQVTFFFNWVRAVLSFFPALGAGQGEQQRSPLA